jgi:opacity protein-like surface antigen
MQFFEKYDVKLIIGVGLITIIGSSVSAQQQSGSFLQSPASDQGLKLNFNTSGTYSDNFLRFSDGEIAEQNGLIAEDYALDLRGNVAFGRRIGRNQLSFDSTVGYRFHDNNTQLDSERFSGRGVFAWQLGARCGGAFGGQWARDNGQFETQSDVLVDNNQTILTGGGEAQCNVLGPLQLSVSAVFSDFDNSATTREVNNREDQFYRGSLRYTFGRGSYLGALVSTSITNFTDRDSFEGAVDRFELLQYAGEANLIFGRDVRLNALVGFTDIQNTNNVSDSLTGVSGVVSLQLPIGSAHDINLTGSRSVIPLQSVTALFARSSDVSLFVNSSWSPRLSSQITFEYTRRLLENDEAIVDPVEGFNDRDTTYSFGARVNYDLGRLVGLNFSYRYSDRSANVDSFEFTENRFMVGLQVNFN